MNNTDLNTLTTREAYILQLLTEGYDSSEISDMLYISTHTVKAHISAILKKLNAKNRTQAVYKAIKDGILKI
ncbi:response regulator transcription factor [Spirochaetes bacterium]|uniref:Response regulator transcription factor n=1 Tax=Candidatus Scatousia excrementipullorum TaxID=2840936 RepID=A0A9D9DN20_9BACT|nr:response regulator transcription factor [Candidatus Scatousia excrementipullorum]